MKAKPKRKSKGKRHPVYAESLDNIADTLALEGEDIPVTRLELITIFRDEAARVRSILR